MIQFKQVPSNIRVPLFYAEVDGSRANSGVINQRTLIIGQITSGGTATANVPVMCQGVADAKTQGGAGSMLALMTDWYRKRDKFGELWLLPLADAGGAVLAAGSINFTAPATAVGTLNLYIGGFRVQMPVLSTQTNAALATALAAAINAATDLPVTAAVDGAVTTKVNITAKNAGATGNDIDLRLNYLGQAGGEATPAGMATTITQLSAGATNPTLTTALANLSSMPFDFIVLPYTDTTSLNAMKAFLDDVTGRWSWATQIYGHSFSAYRGTVGTRATFGTGRNDAHATAMGFNDSPTPSWLWAANLTGAVAPSLRIDPALPVHTLALDVLAPPLQSRDSLTDSNTLLFDGISTYTVDDDGTVRVGELITTYQKNAFSQPDDSFLKANTPFQIANILRRLKTVVTTKYARVKLAANGTRFGAGSSIVTPNVIRGDLIAQYGELEEDGQVQATQAFADGLIVQINSQNPRRVDVLWDGILVNGLDIFALLFQFRTFT